MIERLRRFIDTGNLVRFLLSLILAFALWAWVTNEKDPEQTYLANGVQVMSVNRPDGLEVVNTLPKVDIKLQGPRSVIQTLDAGAIQAFVDLGGRDGPGSEVEKIHVDTPPGIRKSSVNPSETEVEMDTVTSKTFNLKLLSPDDLPKNLTVTETNVNVDQVTVTGVQRNVDRVAQVILPVEIGGRSDSFTTDAVPMPVDADNKPVEPVEVSPGRVTLTVSLEQRGKEIPVFVQCGCTAAEGYAVVGQPSASPPTVLIDGPKEALDQVSYIYTTPVDTSALTSTRVFEGVQIETSSLPEGVTVEPQAVDVLVQIKQDVFSQMFRAVPVQVLNKDDSLTAVVSPQTIDITLEGPKEDVSALTVSDISVVVDIADLSAGTYQIRPRVILPPRIRYSDEPPEVTVTLSRPTPPTPQPAPTATVQP
jgi:YbbR domain-containing protein